MADMKRVDLSAKKIQEPAKVKGLNEKIVRRDPPRHIDINIGIHHLDHRAPEPPNPCGPRRRRGAVRKRPRRCPP